MNKFFQISFAVLVLAVMSGCATNYHHENSGGTTETVHKLPGGGYERTTTYENKGSGPVTYSYPGYGYGSVTWSHNWGGGYRGGNGSPVYIAPAPSARAIEGLLPQ